MTIKLILIINIVKHTTLYTFNFIYSSLARTTCQFFYRLTLIFEKNAFGLADEVKKVLLLSW